MIDGFSGRKDDAAFDEFFAEINQANPNYYLRDVNEGELIIDRSVDSKGEVSFYINVMGITRVEMGCVEILKRHEGKYNPYRPFLGDFICNRCIKERLVDERKIILKWKNYRQNYQIVASPLINQEESETIIKGLFGNLKSLLDLREVWTWGHEE